MSDEEVKALIDRFFKVLESLATSVEKLANAAEKQANQP